MNSKITIDFDYDNRPIIQIKSSKSEDVRDKMVNNFVYDCWSLTPYEPELVQRERPAIKNDGYYKINWSEANNLSKTFKLKAVKNNEIINVLNDMFEMALFEENYDNFSIKRNTFKNYYRAKFEIEERITFQIGYNTYRNGYIFGTKFLRGKIFYDIVFSSGKKEHVNFVQSEEGPKFKKGPLHYFEITQNVAEELIQSMEPYEQINDPLANDYLPLLSSINYTVNYDNIIENELTLVPFTQLVNQLELLGYSELAPVKEAKKYITELLESQISEVNNI